MAVGIFSFAIVAVLGLYSVALKSIGNSQRELDAANLSTSVISDYRLALLENTNVTHRFKLPVPTTNSDTSGIFFPDGDGGATSAAATGSLFKVAYRIVSSTNSGELNIRLGLLFTWPVGATNDSSGSYECLSVLVRR